MEIRYMKTETVVPYGMLYSQGREYFLLHPHPISKDWEGDNAYRFLVAPRTEENILDTVFPIARHIVTNSFVIDFIPVSEMPTIKIYAIGE
jgi:hypothetical protein